MKSHKKAKLYFDAPNDHNFIRAKVNKIIFRFLKKFEQIFVVPCWPHSPHAEPFVEIVSYNFKTFPYDEFWAN